MTAQVHMTRVGKALLNLENSIADVEKALEALKKHRDILHARLGNAQAAYIEANPSENVVAFSGGTNKPPVDDPDEPVDPVP